MVSFWDKLGIIFWILGKFLARSWTVLGRPWAVLRASWGRLGASLGSSLGFSWGFFEGLGAILRSLDAILKDLELGNGAKLGSKFAHVRKQAETKKHLNNQ